MKLADLLPALSPDWEYFSFQKDVTAEDRAVLAAHGIVDLSDELTDFSDTAAVCEVLDLVVTVDTSVAHLSGALGRPTWVLLHFLPDWRWGLGRKESDWYSSVRLFRQERAGDWASVARQVKAALEL